MTTHPITAAVRYLRAHDVAFTPHLYRYEERGGTRVSSRALGIPEAIVVKTLVMEDDEGKPLLVLMPGDHDVSTKALARLLGVKTIAPCAAKVAEKHTGYLTGGTSPFGTKTQLRVYAESNIFELPLVYINGGKRGFLISLDPKEILRVLPVTRVAIGV